MIEKPRNTENAPIDMEQTEDGTYVMKAEEMVNNIEGYDAMTPQEQITAIVSLMEELKDDNSNRHLVEELGRRATIVREYEKLMQAESNLQKLGVNIDVKV